MSLDLGAVVGRVILDTTGFDAKYARLVRRMGMLGGEASKSAGGVRRLDTSLAGAGAAATRAAAGLDKTAAASKRAGTSATQAAGATNRQAAGANRLAEAQARVGAVMARTAGQSTRNRMLALRDMAAQQRLAAAHAEAGSATARQAALTARLASAQAAALGSSKRFAAAQALSSASLVAGGRKMSRAITLPIIAAGAVAIHEAAQFEQATNVYVTAAGESAKNLGVIRDGIKKVAVETGTSIDNLTEAEYVLQKAGYRGADGIRVLDASAKGAREENAQLSDVVQAMTSIMSAYNIPASQSVQVMNALKTGAGSAKVSMEDYTRALSTALPIASANHISVSQLLGTYSQLTQAGNTAQYSTQLLSSTIRAMAAPNRVAQKAMQQFGLNVNDVTGKLGQRGLSGTMKLYIDAITKKMGPSGLVVQDAFNQQASAMQDVNIMLAKMPPNVRALSQQYQDGKLSFKDWRDAMKGLPTDQVAMARSFASVSDRTHAFNDLLKNGDPAAQTFSAALRKMTNGAIGLNTFLQLMGNNFKGVDDRAAAVGKSLGNTDHEVEGWKSTAELASVKADQLKESLHVLAIDGGNALLPMFKRAVDGITGMVHGFQGLDSSQKQILGWSLGIMAAIGPLMFIGGKLRAAGGRIMSAMNFIAGGADGAATRTSVAMARMGAALGAAGLGFAIGSLTKNSSGGTKALGVLGSAAAGAAIGLGTGTGALGAAIGGVAGGLTALISGFMGAGDAAHHAVAATDEYTQAILRDNDALGANTREVVKNDLQKAGLYDAGLKLGISQQTLTDASLGNAAALQKVKLAQGAVLAMQLKAGGSHTALTKTQREQVDALGKLLEGETTLSEVLRVNKAAADNLAAADGKAAKQTNVLAGSAVYTTAQLTNLYLSGNLTARQLKTLVGAKRVNINSDKAKFDLALLQASMKEVAAAYRSLPKSVVTSLKKSGVTDRDIIPIANAYRRLPKSVRTLLSKSGTTPAQIQAIIAKYHLIPAVVNTTAKLNPTPAISGMNLLLASLSNRSVNVRVNTVPGSTGALPAPGHSIGKPGRAAGGSAPEGYFAVGEEGPEIVRKTGAHVQVFSNPQSRKLIEQTGWMFPGFASGTGGISHVGDDWIYGGTKYASKRAAENAQHRGKSKNKDAAKQAVDSAVGSIGQSPSPQIDLSTIGYTRVIGQIRHASDVLGEQIRKGLTASAEKRARAQLAALRRDADKQLAALRVKIKGSDLNAIKAALKGTADDVRGAFDTVIADARNAGASASTVAILRSGQQRLIAKQTQIANARQRLADINEYRGGITDTLGQNLQLGSFGSASDFVAGLSGAANTNNSYAKELTSLQNRVKGNKTLTDLVTKLAAEGQTTSLQTLFGSSSGELAQISKAYGGYTGSLAAGGDAASKLKFGTTAAGQQGTIDTLVGQQTDLVDAMADLTVLMAKRPDVNLKVNGHTITAEVVKDPQFEAAIAGALQRVRNTSQRGRKR